MTTVDVLLPYYGSIPLLQDAVRSVLDQTHEDWRLLVINDAYPHGDPEPWLQGLNDPRIEYQLNPRNIGSNANFQLALTQATAPYFVMMGSDDRMLPGYLSLVHAALERFPEAAAVQPGVEVIDGDGQIWNPLTDRIKALVRPRARTRRLLGGERLAASLMHAGWHYFPSLAWRTDIVRDIGFRPEYDVVQDLALLMDLVTEGHQLLLEPAVAFQYRRHAESDSSKRAVDGRRFHEEGSFFAEQARRFHDLGWPRAERAARLHWTSRLHALTLLRGQPRSTAGVGAGLGLVRYAFGLGPAAGTPQPGS